MVIAIPGDEKSMDRMNAVSKEDAPCPFLVLDILRDGKVHKYRSVIEVLNYVVAVSNKAEDNLYKTIRQLSCYNPSLIQIVEWGGVKYIIITNAGKEQLRWMKELMSPNFTEYFFQMYGDYFKALHSEGSLKIVREGRDHIVINVFGLDAHSRQLGDEMVGYPRYMLALAEKALAHLDLVEGSENLQVRITPHHMLYFDHLEQLREDKVDGGSLDDD